jgi:hypothetical protein
MQSTKTKFIEITLSSSLPVTYTEVIQVPADITRTEVDSLLNLRRAAVKGEAFSGDFDDIEEADSDADDADEGQVPSFIVQRDTSGKLKIEAAPAVESTGDAATKLLTGGIYIHHEEDLHTIIAALRFWQSSGMGEPSNRDDEMQELATNGGEVTSLCDEEIDQLVMDINVDHDPAAFRAQLDALIN